MGHFLELFDHPRLVFLADVGDDVAHALVGLQVLSQNVDLVLRHDLVDGGEDAGLVSVNVDEAMSTPQIG